MQLAIGEVPDAGRMLCRGCSLDPEHQPVIAAYLEKQNTPVEFAFALRQSLLHASRGTPLPPAVMEAIRSRGLVVQEEIARVVAETERRVKAEAREGLISKLGCAVGTTLFIVVMALGLRSLLEILTAWFS